MLKDEPTYVTSHSWITFNADLRRIPYDVWVMIGECQSKCEHLAGAPLLPEAARELHHIYLAKGAHATTAIEANTLSEEQALEAVKGKLRVPPSQEYLATELKNIIDACNHICDAIVVDGPTPSLCREEIISYNKMVLKGLPMKDGGVPGEVPSFNVVVGRYRGAPRSECNDLLDKLCEWLESDFKPSGELEIGMAILQAVLAHLYIAWIHPYADGNGRTARLLEFRILLGRGVPAPASHLLSNHYNLTRAEYYRQLDAASKNGGDVTDFIRYAVQGLRDGLRKQIAHVRKQQLEIVWRNHVHEKFRDQPSRSDKRRRDLVLAISKRGIVPRSDLKIITSDLADQYAGKTERMLTRDLNAVRKMDLIHRTPRGYKANKYQVKAFLAKRKKVGGIAAVVDEI